MNPNFCQKIDGYEALQFSRTIYDWSVFFV